MAKQYDTPAYVYSYDAIKSEFQKYQDSFQDSSCEDFAINYAVKANSNLAILQSLSELGAGFDLVSLGELRRVLAAGGDANKCIFSGVGKTREEIIGALELGIGCFNVESIPELSNIAAIAKEMGMVANISVRVNPNIDAKTHPYISTGLKENKFGISHEDIIDVYKTAASLDNIKIKGIACHIGSQITDLSPFEDSVHVLLDLVDKLKAEGIAISYVDVGGGLGVTYRDEMPPEISDYVKVITNVVTKRNPSLGIHIEPGRRIIANAGVLLTNVIYIKPPSSSNKNGKNFAIVDAAMNDILRPMLYQGWHNMQNVEASDAEEAVYEVVGPICESTDTLANDRSLAIKEGDTVVIYSTGAYCMSMSSNYNSRKRPVELLVDGDKVHVIRERDTIEELYANERLVSR